MAHIHSRLVTDVVIIAKCALWPRLPISLKCLLVDCSLAVGRECHEWLRDQHSWIHSLAFSLSSALVSYRLSLFDALSHNIYPRVRQISACQRVDVSVGAEKSRRDRGERGREEKVESECSNCHLAIRVYCNLALIVCTPYLFTVAVIACVDCAIYLLSSSKLVLFSD